MNSTPGETRAEWEHVRTVYLAEVSDEVGHAQYLADPLAALAADEDEHLQTMQRLLGQ